MKLQNNKGNAFTIVIIVLALFTIFIGTIFMQINNQIKSNKNTLENINSKYAAESGIEAMALKIINQIERKVKTSTESVSSYNIYKTVQDNFATSKKDLLSSYNKILELNKKYAIFSDYLTSMHNIISKNYTQAELNNFIKDMINLKVDLVILISKSDYNKNDELKLEIYKSLDDIDSALINVYSSNYMHENHQSAKINSGSYNSDNKHVIWNDVTQYNPETGKNDIIKGIESTFIKIDQNENSDQSYKLESITKYYNNVLLNSLSKLNDNSWDYKKQKLKDKINNLITNTANSTYWSIETDVKNTLISLSNVNTTIDKYDELLSAAKSNVFSKIDTSIKQKLNEVEKEIYVIYIDGFNNNLESTEYQQDSNKVEITNERVELLRQILTYIETVKIDLIELKCKLGQKSSQSSGDVSESDNNNTTEGIIYIEENGFNGKLENKNDSKLDDNYSYSVNKVEKTPMKVSYNLGKISSIDNIELELISTGNVNGKTYTRKATVEFITKKEGNEFITNYSIKSYEKE